MSFVSLKQRDVYVIVTSDQTFLRLESSDMYDFHVYRVSMLESATFLSIDGAQEVVQELTGLTRSKYRYHMGGSNLGPAKFESGDLEILKISLVPCGLEDANSVRNWPEWKQRAALSNYVPGKDQ